MSSSFVSSRLAAHWALCKRWWDLIKSLHVHLEFLGPAIFKNDLFVAHTEDAPEEKFWHHWAPLERLKMLLRLLSLARIFYSSSLVGMLEIGKAICDSLKNIFLFSFLRFVKKEVTQQNNKSRRQISVLKAFPALLASTAWIRYGSLLNSHPGKRIFRSFYASYPG